MQQRFRLGDWLIDPHAREIRGDGICERIDHKAMAVLCVLAETQGEVVTRRHLMDQIWPETHVTEDVLNVAISTLRKALNDQPKNPSYIKTMPRVGYQLIAPVVPITETHTNPSPSPKHRWRSWPWLVPLGIGLLLAGFALFPRKTLAPIHVLAVLPLANFSGDASQDYLADGMTEALITRLARNPSPKIISRTSVMGYKSTDKNLIDIASELGVEAILEGSVQKEGSRVRVHVQLIDARTDAHLWAEHYDRDLKDLFSLQEIIADAVANQVHTRLSGEPKRVAVAPAAYDTYLRGRYFRNLPPNPNYPQALAHFQKAIAISPHFAPAHAALAEAYFMMAEIGARPSEAMFQRGKDAAEQALALDPNLAQAHTAQAIGLLGLDWDFPAAEAAFKKAMSLDQNDTQCRRWYVRLLTTTGRFDEAIAQIKAIQKLDPIAYSKVTLVNVLTAARRFEEAEAELTRLQNLMPASPQLWSAYASLYEQTGQPEKAFSAFIRYLKLLQTPQETIDGLTATFQKAGPLGVYRSIYASALTPSEDYRSPVLLAEQHVQLGQTETAMTLLEQGFRERDMQILFIGTNHRFGPLHQEPRFITLVRKLGIPVQQNPATMAMVVN